MIEMEDKVVFKMEDVVWHIQVNGDLLPNVFETKELAEQFAVEEELTDYYIVAFDCQ